MKDKSFARDNVDGIIDAYAELLCLSHSKKIIGSFDTLVALKEVGRLYRVSSSRQIKIISAVSCIWPQFFMISDVCNFTSIVMLVLINCVGTYKIIV